MALVTMETGVYDDSQIFTAWDLAADWWWIIAGAYNAQIVGGRALYQEIVIGPNEGVRCSYVTGKRGLPEAVVRYVPYDTKMRLLKVAPYTSAVLAVSEQTAEQPPTTRES